MTTTFVTGATGFIGASVVRGAIASGRRLLGLARSNASAEQLRMRGVEPVIGDLLTPGAWQRELSAADEVVHLAQPQTFGGRVTRARALRYREERLQMDRNLLDALVGSRARIVYVGGTSYYGDQGRTLIDESAVPNPKGWGPYIADAIEEVGRRGEGELSLVQAFPGYVYGPGSWFFEYFHRPAQRGKRLVALGGRSRTGSFVHVDDCAAALLHLLEHGRSGERYFVVDVQPRTWSEFAGAHAAVAPYPVRTRTLPRLLVTAMLGPIASASINSDCVLSSAKLRASGFEFRHPTIEQGLRDVLATLTDQACQ